MSPQATAVRNGDEAVVTVNAGSSGPDSQDWADMLLRLLMRWGERCGLRVALRESTPGTKVGVASATFVACGEDAGRLFSTEPGVHRLVRVSPFDPEHRRHTSFAGVEVVPAPVLTEPDSQIRSYVLHPYLLAKDHRTGEETGDVQRVFDGDLDRFVRAELRRRGEAA